MATGIGVEGLACARGRAASTPFFLLSLLVLLVAPVTSWVTIDGGHTITMHGNTSIGPKLAVGKYDLTVMGDGRIGDVIKADPFSPKHNLDVEGAVSAAQLLFRPKDATTGDPLGGNQFGDGSDALGTDRDVMVLEGAGVKDASQNVTSHTLRFKRQTATVNASGTTWAAPQTPFELTLHVGGASEGDVDGKLKADKSAALTIESLDDAATSASLLLTGRDAGNAIVSTYKLRNQRGVFSISATDNAAAGTDGGSPPGTYDAFSITDERMDLSGAAVNVLPNLKVRAHGPLLACLRRAPSARR